jgi:tetratricopeptide (TPR) repeat protein
MPEFKYDAFISYRRSDGKAVAHWLRRELEGFRAPKPLRGTFGRKLRIYLDTAYERGTSDFYEQSIKPALLSSRFILVVATPDAMRRPGAAEDWIERKVNDFAAGPHGRNVIAVRGAGGFDAALPANLRQRFPNIEIVDLRGASRFWFLNPVRAARLSSEKLKLIAPLHDIPHDEMPRLRQEEEKRQQTQLGGTIGATLGVLLAVTGLSVFAIELAARRHQQTGRIDGALGLVQARQAFAEYLLRQKDTSTAEAAFERLLDDSRRLAREHEGRVDFIRSEAEALGQLGDLLSARGERGRAAERYDAAAVAVVKSIEVRAQPSGGQRAPDSKWLALLARLHRLAGRQFMELADAHQALERFRRSVDTRALRGSDEVPLQLEQKIAVTRALVYKLERDRGNAAAAAAARADAQQGIDRVTQAASASRGLKQNASDLKKWIDAQDAN